VQRRRRHIGHARHRLFIRVLILPELSKKSRKTLLW